MLRFPELPPDPFFERSIKSYSYKSGLTLNDLLGKGTYKAKVEKVLCFGSVLLALTTEDLAL